MLWFKFLHIISIIAWFSGLFYLPRLFICYHKWTDRKAQYYLPIMAYKLYHYIINPAGLCSVIFGCALTQYFSVDHWSQNWFIAKLVLVFIMVIYQVYLGTIVRNLGCAKMQHSLSFYYFLYIIPMSCCTLIIMLTVVQP